MKEFGLANTILESSLSDQGISNFLAKGRTDQETKKTPSLVFNGLKS